MNIPVLYFATTRTFFVHTPELLWSLLYVYFLKRDQFLRALFSLGILITTRPGNLGAVFLLPAFLEMSPIRKTVPKMRWIFGYIGLGIVSILFLSKLLVSGYHGTYLIPMILDFQWGSLIPFFLAEDFGLVWTQFLWLASFLCWVRYFKAANVVVASAGLWLYVAVLATLFWPTRGSTFGYRYLIGSYAAGLLILLETSRFWVPYWGPKSVKVAKIILILGASWGALQCWIYPAPKPYWPWDKPFHTQVGVPYGQGLNWLKQSPDLVKMNRFSQVGQFLEKLGWISPSEFTRQGGIRGYALEGPVGQFNFFLTGVLAIATLFRTVTQRIRRKI